MVAIAAACSFLPLLTRNSDLGSTVTPWIYGYEAAAAAVAVKDIHSGLTERVPIISVVVIVVIVVIIVLVVFVVFVDRHAAETTAVCSLRARARRVLLAQWHCQWQCQSGAVDWGCQQNVAGNMPPCTYKHVRKQIQDY
jgi:hypothetical protein